MIDGRLFFYLSYIKAIKTRHKQITDIHVPRLKLRIHFLCISTSFIVSEIIFVDDSHCKLWTKEIFAFCR